MARRKRTGDLAPTEPQHSAKSRPSSGSAIIEQRSVHVEYRGPVPDPETLRRYGEVIPTAPERILAMAEREQTHRHKLDCAVHAGAEQEFQAELKLRSRAQWMACVLVIMLVALAAWFAWLGMQWPAVSVVAIAISAVVGAFLLGKRRYATAPDQPSESPPPKVPQSPQ